MIKKIMLSFLLIVTLKPIMAQSNLGPISITHGEEIEEDKEKIVRIAGEANGKIYTLATKGKNFFIKVFDSATMGLLSNNEIEMDDFMDKEPEFEDISVLNGKVYIFGSVYDKKNKVANLLAVEIASDGKLTNNKKSLFTTTVTKNRERGAFYFKDSPAGDMLLVMHASLFDKEEVIQYEIKLFNENLDIAMSNLEKVPFNDRNDLEFTIADLSVNYNDDVFLVINESYRDRKSKTNFEKFELHSFKNANDYKKEVTKIDFTDKEIINCQMMTNKNNKVQLVGFYSSVRDNGKANKELKGLYTATIDGKSNVVDHLTFNEFDYDTKVKLLGERRAKKGKDVKPVFVPHSLIEREDGGLMFLSEYHFVIVGQTQGIGPLGVTPYTYINNEIIVTSINPDGTIDWTNVIAKDQKASFTGLSVLLFGGGSNGALTVTVGIQIPIAMMGKGPEYLGAMPIYENGKLTVVFNDNVKNIGVTDIEEIKTLGNYNKAVPTAFVFDNATGVITRIDPEEFTDGQLVLRPGVYYRKAPNDYIIYSSRKSEDRLGRMTIN